MSYELTETPFGFDWGPASIERCISDEKWGVVLTIRTARESVDARVTPSGLIRLGEARKAGRPRK